MISARRDAHETLLNSCAPVVPRRMTLAARRAARLVLKAASFLLARIGRDVREDARTRTDVVLLVASARADLDDVQPVDGSGFSKDKAQPVRKTRSIRSSPAPATPEADRCRSSRTRIGRDSQPPRRETSLGRTWCGQSKRKQVGRVVDERLQLRARWRSRGQHGGGRWRRRASLADGRQKSISLWRITRGHPVSGRIPSSHSPRVWDAQGAAGSRLQRGLAHPEAPLGSGSVETMAAAPRHLHPRRRIVQSHRVPSAE